MAVVAKTVAISWALLVATLAWAGDASALEPAFTRSKLSLAGGPRLGGDNLNLGLGGRFGYTLEQSVYIGVLGDYWFGEQTETSLPFPTKASASGWDVMIDAGYDLGITPTFVIRPFGGAGIFRAQAELCITEPGFPEQCISASQSQGAGIFGGQLMVLVGSGLQLGGELRVMFADNSAAVLAGNIGGVF